MKILIILLGIVTFSIYAEELKPDGVIWPLGDEIKDHEKRIEKLEKEVSELKIMMKKIPLHILAETYVIDNSTEEQINKWKEKLSKKEDNLNQYLLDYFFDHRNEIKKDEWIYTAFLLWYCRNVMPSKVKDWLKKNDEEIKRKILLNEEIKFKE